MAIDKFRRADIILDKANSYILDNQFAKELDNIGRKLQVQVTNSGVIEDQSHLTLTLAWEHDQEGNEGHTLFQTVDSSQGLFSVTFANEMLLPGTVTASIQIIEGESLINTQNFKIRVESTPLNVDKAVAQDSFTVFIDALAGLNKYDGRIAYLETGKADKDFVNSQLVIVNEEMEATRDYTENYLKDITFVPETFKNLAALQAKYPNGKNGLFVVADTGHKYIWGGDSWTDAGYYQAAGIADQTVAYAEVRDKSLNYSNVDFLRVSKNKFNPDELQPDGFHNYTTGVWTSDTAFDTSGKIPCRPGQVWTSQYVRWVCYFDKNKIFKAGGFAVSGGTDELKTFTIPDGVYHFEVTCQKHNTAKQQIEQSSILSDYNEFELKIDNLKIEIDSVNDIKNDSLTIDKMEFIETGKNLFNPSDVVAGYYINPTTGKLNEAANYVTSQLIPVYGRTVGLQKIRFYALFNRRGEYLSGETLSADKLIAENAANAFIRVSPTSGMEDSAQVEYDEITAFEAYKAVLKGVSTESETSDKPSINLPKNIFATTNKELVIYQQNIALDDYDFRWGRGIQGAKSYRETFVDITDKNLSIELYKDAKLINSKQVEIKVSDYRADNIKVLLLGDSTVDSLTTEPPSQARLGYHMIQEMNDKLTLIGTRGLGTSRHEGRGGWTAKDYRSDKTDVTGTNPFYNPATTDFDFSYYMSQTGLDVPDAVVIQLGINDLFNYSNDETALIKINEFINDIEYIANNIRSYNNAIKVVYNLAIPPTEKIDIFGETYQQYNLPQWRYKRNNYLLASEVIKALDNSSTIILNAINKGIDVENNIRDGVHPTDLGYKQIASQIVDCLNSLN